MKFMLDLQINAPEQKLSYPDQVMLVGSCFTEHIGKYLKESKFQILQNPHGILFDPFSVSSVIVSLINDVGYGEKDLFYLNELWHSWQHHSIFSNLDKENMLSTINKAQHNGHQFLKNTKWIFITLGSAFSYRLREGKLPVANCHRAPAQWFDKHLMSIEEINSALDTCIHRLFQFNPDIRILFSVSPVRHIRDGVIENNRSKARLIECVHHLVNKFKNIYYFPAYELVIDVLRDYRFFDIDMVHPNYQATEFVIQQFVQHFIDEGSQMIMEEIKKINIAKNHQAFQPQTLAHKLFLQTHLEKVNALKSKHGFLDLEYETAYFSNQQKP
jgi:GSCFA family